jgi:geranylgeranyl pyrophosphate synthase
VITALRDFGVQEKSLARFSQLVSQTLWEMSRGQFADLGGAHSIRSKEDYSCVIELKTGAEIGLFASAPAVLGGLPDHQIKAWSAFGVAYGCMSQLFTDILSAFSEPPANDLMGGKRTLPVLCTLDLLEAEERDAFERDLTVAASGDILAVKKVKRRMTEKRAILYCLLGVEDLRWRAVKYLPLRLTDLAVNHPLRSILRRFSIL